MTSIIKLILVVGFFVSQSSIALSEENFGEIVLSKMGLGSLSLEKETEISLLKLKKLFPNFKIEYGIGQGDSPDFHYFDVIGPDGTVWFSIQSFIDGESSELEEQSEVRIDLLTVYSPKINDSFGLRVGKRVADIIQRRGDALEFGASHHDVYLGKDNIYYNISTESERGPEQFTLEDAKKGNWVIRTISWPEPAWE